MRTFIKNKHKARKRERGKPTFPKQKKPFGTEKKLTNTQNGIAQKKIQTKKISP